MSVARHSVYNLAGALLPLAVSLVTVPFYLRIVGFDRYGILNLCWVLVGYFGLFDFGIGRATAQRMARLEAAGANARNQLFWTAITLAGSFAALAALVFLPLSRLALGYIQFASPSTRSELFDALPLLIAAVPVGIGSSLLIGIMEGRKAFLAVNTIMVGGSVMTGVLPLGAAFLIGPELPILIMATLVARMGVIVFLARGCWRLVPVSRPRLSDSRERRDLLQFGGWTTISYVVGPFLDAGDRFFIGALISAAAVGTYVLPMTILLQLTTIPQALARALFPRIAAASAEEAARLNRQAVQLVLFIVTPAFLALTVVLQPFFKIWIGSEHAGEAYNVALILIFGWWMNCPAQVQMSRLVASGQPRIVAILHAAEVIPYFAVLYYLTTRFGLAGAAFAWTARTTSDALLLHIFNRPGSYVWRLVATQGALVVATCAIMYAWQDSSPAALAAKSVVVALEICVVVFTVPAWIRDIVRGAWRQRLSSTAET